MGDQADAESDPSGSRLRTCNIPGDGGDPPRLDTVKVAGERSRFPVGLDTTPWPLAFNAAPDQIVSSRPALRRRGGDTR